MTTCKLLSLCLVATLASKSNAFTVAPPVAIDVPVVSVSSAVQTVGSSSNLPSQQQLLDKVGTLNLATASTSTAVVAAPAPKTAAPVVAPKTAAAATPAPAAKSSSTAAFRIAEIKFNGDVPKTEADEYVVLQNASKDTMDVSGYYLYVATSGTQGSTFTFPKGSVIKSNASVRVYTNEIHKESGGYSFGSGKALWNNNGGLAVLKDNSGKKLGEFKYAPAKSA